jgi:hypothetical protein
MSLYTFLSKTIIKLTSKILKLRPNSNALSDAEINRGKYDL